MSISITQRIKLAIRVLIKGDVGSRVERENIPTISDEDIKEIKQFFPMEKFFVFGHARSGTTLLARLIRVHPSIHCNWQGHFFTRPPLLESLVNEPDIAAWLSRRSNRWNQGRDLSPLILRGVCDLILEKEARQLGKSIVGDKSPNSLLNGKSVQLLSHVYPDTRLIFIVRDGRDAIISHRFQSFIDATQHLTKEDLIIRQAFMENPSPFLTGESSIFTPNGIRRAAEGWMHNVTETDRAGKSTFNDNYISLRFEDIVIDPWQEISKIWSFLEVDTYIMGLKNLLMNEFKQNPDADWQQQKASEIAQPLQKGKKGSWREILTPLDRQIFREIAGTTLLEWGYQLE